MNKNWKTVDIIYLALLLLLHLFHLCSLNFKDDGSKKNG